MPKDLTQDTKTEGMTYEDMADLLTIHMTNYIEVVGEGLLISDLAKMLINFGWRRTEKTQELLSPTTIGKSVIIQ